MRRFCILAFMLLSHSALAEDKPMPNFATRIAALEKKEGGHIGVAAINPAKGEYLKYRADERFAMCSTHKLLLVAAVLSRVDASKEKLDRLIEYGDADIQEYAPIAKQHLAEGRMSIADLSAATIQYSDNTAANLLLESIGGPERLTDYMRSLGDETTRLDRNEPALNSNLPDDPRDTTTPSAMVNTMQKLLVGKALTQDSREQLIHWLIGNTTGDKKLRAGMNPTWKIGDKTGAGENGASSDVAIVWPTGSKPFLIAVYYTGAQAAAEKQSAIIAEVGRIVSDTFIENNRTPGNWR